MSNSKVHEADEENDTAQGSFHGSGGEFPGNFPKPKTTLISKTFKTSIQVVDGGYLIERVICRSLCNIL